jgi:GWxTD domain-containing protein
MRLLENWVETPLAGAVGWTLVHSLWEGAIISAALAAALLALRSPRGRYAMALVAMLAMLGVFGLTLVRMTGEDAHSRVASGAPPLPAWNIPAGVDTLNPSYLGLAAVVPWLSAIWMAGVLIFYLRHVAGWISVCRLRRRGVCCAPERWQKELVRLSAQLRISRPVLLLESCMVDAPMALGHLRPLILMPLGLLAGLPAGQVEAILLHELAHIRRYDYLVNLLQRFVEGLLFYHPAIWWMSRVVRAERENCCDDVVVAMSGNPHEYAEALAALEQNRGAVREPAVAATGGNIVKRIRRLLYPNATNSGWTPLFGSVVLMVIAALALAAWQSEPRQQSSAAAQQQTSPYVRWLNQDVVYLTTVEERTAFQKLTTDEERAKFIEQFWLRRDPTPGTAVNEFQEEHYRRIAYATEQFGTDSDMPGWQTDRGHMYIAYGPPDELERHPGGNAQILYPFEMWKYKYVEGIGVNVFFTFIDRMRTGDYRLAPR